MKLHFTKERQWLEKWDEFVVNCDRGSHLLLSDWVNSYASYGFSADYCIAEEDGKIVGGYAAVIAKAAGFTFYAVPFGPIVDSGSDAHLQQIVDSVPERAKKFNACYAHVNLPTVPDSSNSHVIAKTVFLPTEARNGHAFRYVYSSKGFNWVGLDGCDEEAKIMTLKPSVRRNIRNSSRKGLEFRILESEQALSEAYALFKQNSIAHNYTIRDWKDMRQCLMALQQKGWLKMLSVYKDDVLKGAILLVKSGNYYTYILGGSVKEVPDLRPGDFLQWEAVKMSLDEGFDGYNISLGGSAGVVEFKNSFGTEHLLFENGKFHWVLKPIKFRIFQLVEKRLKPYKSKISKLLSKRK